LGLDCVHFLHIRSLLAVLIGINLAPPSASDRGGVQIFRLKPLLQVSSIKLVDAIDLLDSAAGLERVIDFVNAISHGVFM
jgi:hypothetical protein